MEWVETTGKTIEDAKEAALDELGVDEQDAEFEILEEPRVGLFGRVRTEARVRARVRPTAPRAKLDRRDRRRRTRGNEGGEAGPPSTQAGQSSTTATGAETPARTASRPSHDGASTGRAATGGRATSGGPAARVPSDDAERGEDGSAGPRPTRSRRRRSRGGRGRSGPGGDGAKPEVPAAAPVPATLAANPPRASSPPDDEDAHATPGPERPERWRRERGNDDRSEAEGELLMDVALSEQGKVAEQFLTGLLSAFGVTATTDVAVSDEDERVDLRIKGDRLGLLIGPRGATLLAIQELTRTVVQHRTNARNGRIYVDVADYRERRAAALTSFATRVAADVVAQQQSISLEPMNAADRKLVHDTVGSIAGVTTRSEGEDERRHIVILPAEPGGSDLPAEPDSSAAPDTSVTPDSSATLDVPAVPDSPSLPEPAGGEAPSDGAG